MLDSASDSIILHDLNGKFIYFNEAAYKLRGYTEDEFIEMNLYDLVKSENHELVKINLEKIEENGSAVFESINKCKDGSTLNMELNCHIIKSQDENLILSVGRDITERKKAENTTMQAKEEWERTFDAVPDLIFLLDTDFHVLRSNKPMADKLCLSTEETVGLTCYEMMHGTNTPPSFCPHKKLVEDSHQHTADVHIDHLDSYFTVSVSPLYYSDGEIMGSVHVARDITKRIKAENEVKKSLKEKEMLLKEIHHRVKNNLMIISSLLSLQSNYITDEESREMFRESGNRANSMALIHQRLYESTDLKNVGFKDYITSLANDLYNIYVKDPDRVGLKLEIGDVKLDIDIAIPLALILNELITNSLKHAFPNNSRGIINVCFFKEDDVCVLKVCDDGVGFPEDLDFMNNTDSLGLQLVNSLTSQIDGVIELYRNNGTTFKITFKDSKIA